ncbi:MULTISPECIES: SDR family oxidoreductase [unclassified Mesorhizobium]|uniref:SDR family oxidoreductase n=1 Tax=unclassified Mesorhizobium TaxID=325217 RepID=UPI0011280264|nr:MULTISPECIES: aldehyde reductase [unclassified Mesorhizobium]MBZ9701420.1 aldehyde reductase [Mesorhizobium sp. CO1-1-3]MBZ9948106.1 aldehyde reductase [Mesorhizobium sp. BR1-1-11]TPJ03062.1 aldehyde reductase [Mesorhizobium sp. B2-8-1]TPJ62337.1 aldehyde reductase [Mesorhizobium sp. B2-6-1]
MSGELVLVTGGSGFLGAHCILELLKAGYRVRTTVRSAGRQADVLAMLKAGGVEPDDRLSFAIADLMSDAGWPLAAAGCDYVLHVASPFPPGVPKHDDELIIPAREGALRVLRAARDAGVRRVVLTSSFAAVGYGKMPPDGRPFTEENWTDPMGRVSAYVKSKTLAERAAWDFIAAEGGGLELAAVNPVGIFGPVLGSDHSTSTEFVQRMMNGAMPGLPRLSFGAVDARDVADLHVRAMTDPAANGERFLAVAGDFMTVREIAQTLRKRLGNAAKRVSTRELPDWLVRMVGLFNPEVAQLVPELGKVKNATNAKAVRMLGWKPRSREDALAATGESLIRHGLIKTSK